MNNNAIIRIERPSDIAAIREMNELAFGQPGEATPVDALRAGNAITLSLVADLDAALSSPYILPGVPA